MLSDTFSLDTRKYSMIYSSLILKHVNVNEIRYRPNGIKPINVNAIYSRRNAIFDLLFLSYNLKINGNQFHGDKVPEKVVVAQISKIFPVSYGRLRSIYLHIYIYIKQQTPWP
jgi:hypothetical protein